MASEKLSILDQGKNYYFVASDKGYNFFFFADEGEVFCWGWNKYGQVVML